MKNSIIATAFLLCSTSTYAAQMYFSGDVISTCSIATTQAGTLDPVANNTLATVSPAMFQYDTNVSDQFEIGVYTPTSFNTSPTLGFSPNFDVFPATISGSMNGVAWSDFGTLHVQKITSAGSGTVATDLIATAPSPNVFPAGFYDVYSTVTCTAY